MRVARDKSKAGSHPPPARRASIHVALNVNRTDRERGRAAKSKSFRATVSHGQIEDSKSKGHPSFHLFQSGHWPIATADSLSFPFFLSLSCGEKAALRSSPASLSPWHVFPSALLPLFSPSFPVIHPFAGRLSIRTFQHQLPRGRWLCLCSGK